MTVRTISKPEATTLQPERWTTRWRFTGEPDENVQITCNDCGALIATISKTGMEFCTPHCRDYPSKDVADTDAITKAPPQWLWYFAFVRSERVD